MSPYSSETNNYWKNIIINVVFYSDKVERLTCVTLNTFSIIQSMKVKELHELPGLFVVPVITQEKVVKQFTIKHPIHGMLLLLAL